MPGPILDIGLADAIMAGMALGQRRREQDSRDASQQFNQGQDIFQMNRLLGLDAMNAAQHKQTLDQGAAKFAWETADRSRADSQRGAVSDYARNEAIGGPGVMGPSIIDPNLPPEMQLGIAQQEKQKNNYLGVADHLDKQGLKKEAEQYRLAAQFGIPIEHMKPEITADLLQRAMNGDSMAVATLMQAPGGNDSYKALLSNKEITSRQEKWSKIEREISPQLMTTVGPTGITMMGEEFVKNGFLSPSTAATLRDHGIDSKVLLSMQAQMQGLGSVATSLREQMRLKDLSDEERNTAMSELSGVNNQIRDIVSKIGALQSGGSTGSGVGFTRMADGQRLKLASDLRAKLVGDGMFDPATVNKILVEVFDHNQPVQAVLNKYGSPQ